MQLAGLQIDMLDARLNQSRSGHLRQWAQINVELVHAAVAGEVGWQSAGIGRIHIAGHQCHFQTGHRFFCQVHQHGQMAVAAAEQDKTL